MHGLGLLSDLGEDRSRHRDFLFGLIAFRDVAEEPHEGPVAVGIVRRDDVEGGVASDLEVAIGFHHFVGGGFFGIDIFFLFGRVFGEEAAGEEGDEGGKKSTAKGDSKKKDGPAATRKSKRVSGEAITTEDPRERKSARTSLPKSVAHHADDKYASLPKSVAHRGADEYEGAVERRDAELKRHDKEKASKRSWSAAPNSDEKKRINAAIKVVNDKYGDGEKKQKRLAMATFRGVTCRPSGKWQAQVYYARKSRYIGVFESRENACLAYEVARELLHAEDIDPDTEDKVKTASEIAIARKAAFAIIAMSGSTSLSWRQLLGI